MADPEDDKAYHQRRAEEELRLAQQAKDPDAVAAHYQLAELYLERVTLKEGSGPGQSPQDG